MSGLRTHRELQWPIVCGTHLYAPDLHAGLLPERYVHDTLAQRLWDPRVELHHLL